MIHLRIGKRSQQTIALAYFPKTFLTSPTLR
jgi:hypothetical protein